MIKNYTLSWLINLVGYFLPIVLEIYLLYKIVTKNPLKNESTSCSFAQENKHQNT